MRILAIETSTRQCSVALALPDEVVQLSRGAGDRLAEHALAMIKELLASRALQLHSVDAFAFGSGPGAFTGLRAGCGLVQGLAFGCDRPVVPVGTLKALAFRAAGQVGDGGLGSGAPRRVMAATDARMGQMYWAVYQSGAEGAPQELAAPALASPAQVRELVASWRPDVIAGDALNAFPTAWPESSGAVRLPQLGADASAVARLARTEFAAGRAVPARDAAPDYVRDQVALTVAQRLGHGGPAT